MSKFFRILLVFVCVYVSGCSAEKIPPTQVAAINIQPDKYSNFVEALDAAMWRQGLRKFPPAPGLSELLGRPVLFFQYKYEESEKKVFLIITDDKGISKIEILVFENYFRDAGARKNALESVRVVVEKFGGTVVSGKF